MNADDEVISQHIQVIAGGHKKMYGVNYMETFSSVAKMPSLQVILAMAAQLDWELHQVDVKSVYLNAKLSKEVYMIPPQGVLKPGQEGMICKLKRALYGLKQAGCEWYKTLKEVLKWDTHNPMSTTPYSIFIPKRCMLLLLLPLIIWLLQVCC
jgi:hypothetical protein